MYSIHRRTIVAPTWRERERGELSLEISPMVVVAIRRGAAPEMVHKVAVVAALSLPHLNMKRVLPCRGIHP